MAINCLHLTRYFFKGILIYALLFAINTQRLRSETRTHQSVRQACLDALAGIYLSAYDQKVHTQKYVVLLERKIKALKTAHSQKLKEYQRNKQLAEQSPIYDEKLALKRDLSKTELDSITQQIHDITNLLNKAREQLGTWDQKVDELKKDLSSIFIIEPLKSDPQKKYPFTLHYKSKCPTYRFLCPLPISEAYHLLRIARKYPEGQSCIQYAHYSGAAD